MYVSLARACVSSHSLAPSYISMAMDEDMPEDVLMLILSRLSVKSLLRFKSVSKHWISLIQNPSFISLHNNRPRKNDSLLVKRFLKKDNDFSLSLASNETPILNQDVPYSSQHVSDVHLFGSFNGVVCLANSFQIILCNPAMREFRLLPQPPYHTGDNSHVGFAFDPQANDYKVLRVVTFYDKFTGVVLDPKVQIYNMSTDSWRHIVTAEPMENIFCRWPYRMTWLDAVFYWVSWSPPGWCKIIAFHIIDGFSEQVFLPEDDLRSSLFVLRNSLALVALKCRVIDIWVRDGKGVKDPWVKKYSIEPTLGRYDALGFRQNGELLRLRDKDSRLVSYNLDTQEIEEFDDVYDDPGSIDFQVLSYTENLVSVKRRVFIET